MDEYRVGLTIEPTDDYKKAQQDLFQALASFSKLNNIEKDRLIRETFAFEISRLTAEQFQMLICIMNTLQQR